MRPLDLRHRLVAVSLVVVAVLVAVVLLTLGRAVVVAVGVVFPPPAAVIFGVAVPVARTLRDGGGGRCRERDEQDEQDE